MKTLFMDKGEISWRKIMTCCALLCFMISVMGYLVKYDFAELPASYQAIIAGVFTFYFMKGFLRNVKITKDEPQTNNNEQ
jgi:hypothetical protein